jgi:hypothetical protein
MWLKSGVVVFSLLLSTVDAGLQQISNWGTNPGGLTLHAYVPNNLAAKPAVILAVRMRNHVTKCHAVY